MYVFLLCIELSVCVMVDRDWIALAGFDDILSGNREPSKANLNIPPKLGQQDLIPTTTIRVLLSPKKLNDFGTMPGSRFYHQRLSRQLSQPPPPPPKKKDARDGIVMD
jgi:hypothetical protein